MRSSQGIMDLSWEMILVILEFLPRAAWKGFALTCRRFRLELAAMVLIKERVIPSLSDDARSWKLHFMTSGAFLDLESTLATRTAISTGRHSYIILSLRQQRASSLPQTRL